MSESTNISEQCLACKIISVSALVTAGLYVMFNAKNCQTELSKKCMKGIGGVSIGIGIARLLDLYPCRHKFCQR